MKKILFVVLAAVGLASCVQTEELSVANNHEAIAFDTFVENATKAMHTTESLQSFNVYGTISQNGTYVTTIFDAVEVSKATGVWAYGSQYTQYWIPGFHYDFAAVVDGTVVCENGLPATISTDMTEQKDVLYAFKDRDFTAGQSAQKVNFQFAHLLSKAKFTVKNGIVNGQNFVYNVESINITNADKEAEYDVATGEWTATNTYGASFGAISEIGQLASKGNTTEVLLVPGTKELAIAIKYSLKYGDATLISNDTKNLTAVLTLEKGNAYNFVVEFGAPGEDIKFDAVVDTWIEGNYDVNGTSVVATAEALELAFASEGIDNIVLADDIVLDATTRSTVLSLIVASGKTLTLDLNGHTLSGNWHKGNGAIIKNEGTLTVVNGTISSLGENGGSAIQNSGIMIVTDATLNGAPNANGSWPSYTVNNTGNLTLNNVKVTSYHGAVASYEENALVTLNDSEIDMRGIPGFTSHGIYTYDSGKVVVNGGIYTNYATDQAASGASVINGSVEVNAGIFSGRLENYYGTPVFKGGSYTVDPKRFVAEGYKTLMSDGKYVVVAEGVDAVASTQDELVSALEAGGDVVLTAGEYTFPAGKIKAGTTINCADGTIFTGTSSLDIQGATVIGATFKNEDGIAVSGTIHGTLKNCTFEGEEALRWCYTAAGKTVVFENCVINNDFRGFHFDDMKGDVLFKNCHINGFNAYGGEGTATFEGCTFGTDTRSRYNGLNIYANTVLTNCTFIYKSGKTNFIDMEAVGKSLTITNCSATLDGAAVNVVDYVGGSKLPECTVTIDGKLYIAPVTTAEELKKAINAGEQTIYVKGQIDLTEEILANYNGTIIGADDTACINTRTFVVKAADEAFHLSNKTINFKNITIKVPAEDGDFLKTGFVAAGTMNFDHCVFEGQVTLNGGATWTFDDCEFGGADSGAYASFVYGAKKVTFNRCSFSGVDRAAKVYGTGGVIDVEYNNCTFTSTTSNKYAVNIDASYATTTVALNGCSQTGMPGLYLVAGTMATVYVDGVQQ